MPRRDPAKLFTDTADQLRKCWQRMDYSAGTNEEAWARIRLMELCADIAVQRGFAIAAPDTRKPGPVVEGRYQEPTPAIGGPEIEP